jgi:hypothetical protein
MSNSLTTASCPFHAAHDSGVRPSSVLRVDVGVLLVSSSLITALCPYSAAHDSDVWPYIVSLELTSMPSFASSSLNSAVRPASSFLLISALSLASARTATICNAVRPASFFASDQFGNTPFEHPLRHNTSASAEGGGVLRGHYTVAESRVHRQEPGLAKILEATIISRY